MADIYQHQDIFKNAGLIVRHLRGELSPDEQEAFNQWLTEDKRNRLFLETLSNEPSFRKDLQFFSSVDVSSAWQKVAQHPFKKREVKLWEPIAKWKYAALLTFFITAGLAFYIGYNKEKQVVVAQKINQHYKDDVLPGGDKARLELADGSVVVLENVSNGSLQSQGGTQVVKQDGQLVYNAAKGNHSVEISYNKISTPKGGQYQVILADGSKVWLNAGSSLRFPTAFTDKEREVELTGEAYFEVAKQTVPSGRSRVRVPFKVKTYDVSVEVLGTHFNVMAYSNEKSINTTLLEGSVKVSQLATHQSQLLRPGQQAKVKGSIQLLNVDTEEIVAWKNGFFQFNGADIKTVMGQIERWYDVEIDYEGKLPLKHFTGVISRNINVSKVLNMLELTGGVKFEIKGKRISVVSK
ncbi:MAG: FecR family protein [Daejeonella sp.]